jgi:hypothetical protein
MPDEQPFIEPMVPISGRLLSVPPGPFLHVQRADAADYKIGEFRAWAGYKNLGADAPTEGLAHFQHVLSFAGTKAAGRTGIHAHLAHAHIVIPTSGRGVFSYDGVVTEAAPGAVIVQHAGTVHDQFLYSHSGASEADNRRTRQAVEPPPPGAPVQSFSFLELFVPRSFANVEIVPPGAVTPADQATAWDHPYHRPGADFFLQRADAPDAAYRPVAGQPELEMRDAGTWGPSDGLVATWIIRPASAASPADGVSIRPTIAGEAGGVEIFYMVNGSGRFRTAQGDDLHLGEGDTSTHSQDLVAGPFECSPDMRLLRFLIAAKCQTLRERTPDEIARIEAMGPRIIRRRELRAEGDLRPVNGLRNVTG